MKTEIYNILGVSKLHYLNYVNANFNRWCEHIGLAIYVPARALQSSTSLYNYFVKKWDNQLVRPFLMDNREYLRINGPNTIYADLFEIKKEELFYGNTGSTFYYPSAITNEIKQNHYKTLLKS